MTKRVLIIYRVDEAIASNKGVIRKLDGQAKGFSKNGWSVDTIRILAGNILLNREPIKKLGKSKFGSVLFEFFQSIDRAIDLSQYDMLYIRYGLSFAGFISFIKRAKEENAQLKILLEFATYPYADEWTGAKGLVVKKVDSHYRARLKNYVDYVIHLGEEKKILGMNCINSENGIDMANIRVRSNKSDSQKVNLIAVGKWQFWHGLDRLISGIGEASKAVQDKFRLVIVGDGPAIADLKTQSTQLNLQDVISFVGEKIGDELDELFDHADIGVGTLGMHRKNVKIDSSLKHREYASRGLPFILCTNDKDFSRSLKFVKYFEENEESIDIENLFEFDNQIKKIDSQEIRSYAQNKLSWKAKISRILDGMD